MKHTVSACSVCSYRRSLIVDIIMFANLLWHADSVCTTIMCKKWRHTSSACWCFFNGPTIAYMAICIIDVQPSSLRNKYTYAPFDDIMFYTGMLHLLNKSWTYTCITGVCTVIVCHYSLNFLVWNIKYFQPFFPCQNSATKCITVAYIWMIELSSDLHTSWWITTVVRRAVHANDLKIIQMHIQVFDSDDPSVHLWRTVLLRFN